MQNSPKPDALFWKKKEFVSFILSVLVFLIHISSIAQYGNSGTTISIINEKVGFFLKESITRFAVPMFFILSGISFFKDYDNSKYLKKIKSRIFTLLIPFLLWNTLWTIFELICSYSFISNYFVGRQPFELTFVNVLKGIFFYKANIPFWFLFNLFVFSLASPLINIIIRNKYIGIISVLALSIATIFGIELPISVFYSPISIYFYLIGAIIGKHFFGFVLKKSNKQQQICSIIFLVLYISAKNIFYKSTHLNSSFCEIIVFTAASFALWNILDMFIHKIKPKPIYSRSFAVYALHSNISAIITKLIYICLPKYEWMAIPNLFVTIITTLILINFICNLLEKFFPKLYSILMGKRLQLK